MRRLIWAESGLLNWPTEEMMDKWVGPQLGLYLSFFFFFFENQDIQNGNRSKAFQNFTKMRLGVQSPDTIWGIIYNWTTLPVMVVSPVARTRILIKTFLYFFPFFFSCVDENVPRSHVLCCDIILNFTRQLKENICHLVFLSNQYVQFWSLAWDRVSVYLQ